MGTKVENNKVKITGKVVSDFSFSHEVFGEGFYMMYVEVQRLSDSVDTIPVMVSERMLDVNKNFTGQYVSVNGQFRSHNQGDRGDGKRKLMLYVFVQDIQVLGEDPGEDVANSEVNMVELDGFICRDVSYRKTPLGREIADLLLAVNRPYGKSDYLPCICWGRNARYAEGLSTSTRLHVWGRIQSRNYIKKISETETEQRVAYEISINKLKLVDEMAEDEENTDVAENNEEPNVNGQGEE